LRSAARAVIEVLEPRQLLAAGDPDPAFGGGDGFATAPFTGLSTNHDTGEAMVVQPDGKIIIAGRSGNGSNTADRVAIARFNTDGSLDSSFDGDGLVTYTLADTDVAAVALAPDGKIVVAGRTTFGVVQTWDWFVMRFNSDGSPDLTFGGGDGFISKDFGQNFGEEIQAVKVQSDNKIVVVGTITEATSNLATARFLENGDPDNSFSGDGFDIVDFFGGVDAASDLIVDPDGKIVVVGGSVPAGSYRRFVLLRYNANGTLDNTFDGDGKATTDFAVSSFAKAIFRDPAGNYVVGGLEGGSGTAMNWAVARYTSTGALDSTFGTNASLPGTTLFTSITGHTFESFGIARQNDGKLLFGGSAQITNGNVMGLVRLSSAGVPDSTFGAAGVRTYDSPPGFIAGFGNGADVAIASDGKILLGGEAWLNDKDFAVYKLVTDGGVVQPPVFLNGAVLTVTGTSGDDVLTLSADNTTFTAIFNGQTFTFPAGSVTSINVNLGDGNDSETHITGVRGGTVVLGNGNDTLFVGTANKTSPVLNVTGGLGDDTVTLDVAFFTPTTFDGGGGNDIFNYNSSEGDDDVLITANQITDGGFYPGTYSNVERVNLFANFGFDTIRLQGTSAGTTYVLDGGDGDDTFIMFNSTNPDVFTSPVTFIGGPDTDEIRFDDSPDTYNDNYTITPTSFTRDLLATFNYQSTETLRVSGAAGPNAFSVSPSSTTSIFIDGNSPTTSPGDSINIGLTGATGTDFTLLSAGGGRYTFTNRMPVEYQEVESDLTAFGPTVKNGVFNYQTRQILSIQFSEDTQDISLSDLVVKNLTTNTTISSSIFVLTHNHGPGIATLAEWKVGLGNLLPDGNYQARLPAGSVRDVNGNLLTNDYVLNFFVLTGDLNRDKMVTIADFIDLASNFGKTNATFADGDGNYDQQVTIADFIDLASRFGQSLAGSAEPIPMAAASGEVASAADTESFFAMVRAKSHKAAHHRRRAHLPRLARPLTPMFRRG